MDATRTSLRGVAEWVAAAGILFGVIAAGSVALREFRSVAAVTPVSAREAAAQVPTAGVPDRAVSVPVLLLPDFLEIRVGDAAVGLMQRLSRFATPALPASEQGPNGERQTRTLEYAGIRFVLVLEPFERDAEPRVAAIYLP